MPPSQDSKTIEAEDNKARRVAHYVTDAARVFSGEGTYRGLKAHSLPGLHEYVTACLRNLIPPSALVLELGSGAGALAARLSDLGYRVTAADLVTENFRLHGEVPFLRLDLDSDFASQFTERFDAIAAVEIIEHLENPWHFLRECALLLKQGGNCSCLRRTWTTQYRKLSLCASGHTKWFDDHAHERDGHISPLSLWRLKKCASAAGLEIVVTSSFGDPYSGAANWLKLRLFAKLVGAVTTTARNLQGEILVVTLSKSRSVVE